MTNRREFISRTAMASGAMALPGIFSAGTSRGAPLPADGSQPVAAGKSPLIKLNNGVQMPVLGVGSFALPTIQAADDIRFALQNGYRLVDTAANYGNEKEVGQGIAASGVPRQELFITTKLWIEDFGYDSAMRAFDKSLGLLGLDYIDLYLLHWPVPTDFKKTISAYKALEKLYSDKRLRAIGVSNFNPEHLRLLMDETDVVPAVNQVELHPYLNQKQIREANEKLGIVTEAWSPIGGGFTTNPKNPAKPVRLLEDYAIVKLAEKHKKFTAQIVLRWHIQHGRIAIPKSQHYERLLGNIDVFGFELSAEDMSMLDNLGSELRSGPSPETFDIPAFKALVAKRGQRLQQ